MQFKTDENLPPDVADTLRRHGHDVATVWDQGLRGRPDVDLAEVCRREGRTLITLDLGFADIRNYPPEQYAGLIVLRVASQSRSHVLSVVERLPPLFAISPLAGHLWIVDENTVRIRGPEEQTQL